MSAAAIMCADLERGIVTPEAGSRPVGTEASRRSARSPASALRGRRNGSHWRAV